MRHRASRRNAPRIEAGGDSATKLQRDQRRIPGHAAVFSENGLGLIAESEWSGQARLHAHQARGIFCCWRAAHPVRMQPGGRRPGARLRLRRCAQRHLAHGCGGSRAEHRESAARSSFDRGGSPPHAPVLGTRVRHRRIRRAAQPRPRTTQAGAMKVLAVVPNVYDKVPAQRFRIEQWEPWLAEDGVTVEYASFESPELSKIIHQKGKYFQKMRHVLGGMLRRIQLATRIADYDLIYVFRESALIGPAWFERWAKMRGRPMVFDFDDAVWVAAPSLANGWLSALKMPGKTRTSCRLATRVIAGNPYLAEYALRVNPETSVVPTTIEL